MKPEEVGKYMGAIGEGVKKLALEMKQPVEQVYELFLRQNYVKGIIGVVQIMAIMFFTFLTIKLIQWGLVKEKDEYRNRFENSEEMTVLAAVMVFFLL